MIVSQALASILLRFHYVVEQVEELGHNVEIPAVREDHQELECIPPWYIVVALGSSLLTERCNYI